MKITIIGAGNMGRGIGTRAIAGGHDVEILDRDPAEARALADQLGGSASVTSACRESDQDEVGSTEQCSNGGPAARTPPRGILCW
jgi:3-hydroxyisobutyrate dehydrogenase-like beta-hydroxyacid dehydrogenase